MSSDLEKGFGLKLTRNAASVARVEGQAFESRAHSVLQRETPAQQHCFAALHYFLSI